jgi:exosortase
MISGAMCAAAVAITFCLLAYRAGGRWALHFLFPIAFIFAAAPWPHSFENHLIQTMMEFDASIAVKGLQWIGLPALQRGSVIQIGGSLVGVNEACSGIRSLQTTWMMSLFLGELYRMGLPRRVFLVLAGLIIALFCNLGRIFILLWLTARDGSSAMEQWHDTAGLAVLAASTLILWCVASALRGRPAAAPAATETNSSGRVILQPWPRAFLIGLGLWVMAVGIIVEAWYGTAPSGQRVPMWTVAWPARERDYREVPIPQSTHEILGNTEGNHALWMDRNGVQWSGYFLRWAANQNGYNLAQVHQPQNCLSAAGMNLTEDEGVRIYQVKGVKIPFRCMLFQEGERSVRVWFTLWDDDTGASLRIVAPEITWAMRIEAVMRRRHDFGVQSLEIAMTGNEPLPTADEAFRQLLESTVRMPQ